MKTISKVRQDIRVEETSQTRLDAVSKATIAAMGAVSAIIGLWAMACLVSAMIGSGGLLALTKSWFQAVSGM